jgi:hypothetical protein
VVRRRFDTRDGLLAAAMMLELIGAACRAGRTRDAFIMSVNSRGREAQRQACGIFQVCWLPAIPRLYAMPTMALMSR